jgi:hypothetical protein
MSERLRLEQEPNENVESKVVLHFFRHAEPNRDADVPNESFELTTKGREQALHKSADLEVDGKDLDQSVAFGSPRNRSRHTAALVMAGESSDLISRAESLEEIKAALDMDLKVGSKIGVDPRLDFYMDADSPFWKEAEKATGSKEYLKFLVERSDQLAAELGDEKASTYSRQASNVASVIKKYMQVCGQWDKLVESQAYSNPKLERFLGSHGGILESFLLKLVERVKGVEERDRLLRIIPNHFDYTEGIDVILTTVDSKPSVRVVFKHNQVGGEGEPYNFDETISPEIIDDIIQSK